MTAESGIYLFILNDFSCIMWQAQKDMHLTWEPANTREGHASLLAQLSLTSICLSSSFVSPPVPCFSLLCLLPLSLSFSSSLIFWVKWYLVDWRWDGALWERISRVSSARYSDVSLLFRAKNRGEKMTGKNTSASSLPATLSTPPIKLFTCEND